MYSNHLKKIRTLENLIVRLYKKVPKEFYTEEEIKFLEVMIPNRKRIEKNREKKERKKVQNDIK